MSPNNGKNIIDLNAVRAHKKDDREIQFTPQTSSRSSNQPVNRATTRRPTPRRRTNASNQKEMYAILIAIKVKNINHH